MVTDYGICKVISMAFLGFLLVAFFDIHLRTDVMFRLEEGLRIRKVSNHCITICQIKDDDSVINCQLKEVLVHTLLLSMIEAFLCSL